MKIYVVVEDRGAYDTRSTCPIAACYTVAEAHELCKVFLQQDIDAATEKYNQGGANNFVSLETYVGWNVHDEVVYYVVEVELE